MNKNRPRKNILLKVLKRTGIAVGSVLLLLFVLPFFFPDTIVKSVQSWTNNNINGKVNFSKIRLSFYNHFPSLTLTLYDFSLKGSPPYPNDTLVAANEIALGVNLYSIFFESRVLIDRVYLDDARLNVQVDDIGNANYNILKSKDEQTKTNAVDTGSANLKIKKIQITDCHFTYNDRSIPLLIDAEGFDYIGTGDLSNAIFDLNSDLNIDALDLVFDHEEYLHDKKINADLVTQINTNSLAFIFSRNDLRINKLKLDFTGVFRFLSNGYLLDFEAGAPNIKLHSLVTALPPKYLKWLEKTEVKGNADLLFALKGNYIASKNEKPNVLFKMNIRDGLVAYDKHTPASNLQFRFATLLPSLNTDSLRIDIDTFSFNVEQDFFDARFHTIGLEHLDISASIKMDMDLGRLRQAIGFEAADVKGRFKTDISLKGPLVTKNDKAKSGLARIPSFVAKLSLSNGYFKLPELPQGISNINFDVDAQCADGLIEHTKLYIDRIQATALNNFIEGKIKVDNLVDYAVDADFHSKINLTEIKNFIPMDSMHLAGQMNMNLTAKGRYSPKQKQFPIIKFDLSLLNGSVQTKYYPRPITNIHVSMDITDPSGTMQDVQLAIHPLKFDFEGRPFLVKILLKNLADIHYNVVANGELDFAKIFSVFAQKDLNVSGYAKMDVHFQGQQSDALNGRYARLYNSGQLQLKDLSVQHLGYLPKPFLLRTGQFSFRNDKLFFDQFKASYGQSDLSINGYLNNVINYVLGDKEKLKGVFNLQSQKLYVDEFIPKANGIKDSSGVAVDTAGVLIVPNTLNLTFNAKAQKIFYDGLIIDSFSGQMVIDSSKLKLNNTGFRLIGTTVNMDAVYQNKGSKNAVFAFTIQAKDFDIRKAYRDLSLFRDMAPSAASAQGVVSLDYQLKGRLDSVMSPIYPSLEGTGTLSVRNVKFKGFKMLNYASKQSGKEVLKDPDMKNVLLKTTIKNNIISLEKVKIKMAGFRLRVEGESDFDHRIRYKMRLGLPPLGIIGIPMTVSGTTDNPKIKVGKEDQEELPEQEDEESVDNNLSIPSN